MNRCTVFTFLEISALIFGGMEKTLVERDKQVIWHPYTAQKYAPDPIPIVKGEGVYLFDSEGRTYIDAISSWWVNIHGHAHPYIAEKIYAQAKTLEQVIFAGFTHEPAVQLAERLLTILPGDLSKVFYSDNGSTAVEVAIKMALQYWWNGGGGHESRVGSAESGRDKIVALSNSYHGDTFGAMSVSDRGVFTLAFHDKLFDVIFIDPSNLHEVAAALESGNQQHSQLKIPVDEIACFIYEPLLQGAGGMRMYSAESLNLLLRALKRSGVICIADEVLTGFGRTGRLFASEYLEAKADIVCLSKGLTGGTMAFGVTACSKQIHDAFISDDRFKTFFHGHSYTANPLACTAALASLDLLQGEDCIKGIRRINEMHLSFMDHLKTIATEGNPNTIKNIRVLGTILAFEIVTGKDEYLNNVGQAITRKALAEGVFLRPLGNTLYIMPPYCITQPQLQQVYEVILKILKK